MARIAALNQEQSPIKPPPGCVSWCPCFIFVLFCLYSCDVLCSALVLPLDLDFAAHPLASSIPPPPPDHSANSDVLHDQAAFLHRRSQESQSQSQSHHSWLRSKISSSQPHPSSNSPHLTSLSPPIPFSTPIRLLGNHLESSFCPPRFRSGPYCFG